MSARPQRVERETSSARKLSAVEPNQKKRGRRLPWLVIVSLVCVFAVVFGVLLSRVVLVKSSFHLQKMQEDLAAAEEVHEELMLRAAKKESPARIERVARAMGMVDPPTVNYIVADVPRKSQNRFAYGKLDESVPTDGSLAAVAGESP